MDYGEILRRTWQITWRYKGLWVLGILAGCSSSGRGNGGGQSTSGFQGYDFQSGDFPQLDRYFRNFPDQVPESAWLILLAILCLILFIALVFLLLGVLGQSGLIAGFRAADSGESVSLAMALQLGVENFGKILGIRIIVWLIGLVVGVFVAVSILLFGVATLGIGWLCLIPLLCLALPLLIVLGIGVDGYVILSMVAAIEEDVGVFEAFSLGWRMLRDNLGPVVVMGLILILGGGILSIILTLPFAGVILPAIVGILEGSERAIASGVAVTLVCGAIALPVLVLLNGIITTFTTGAWTLTYRRLIGEEGVEFADA